MSEKNQTTGDTQISTHENLIATKLIEQGFYYDGIDNKQQSIVTIVDAIKKNPSTLIKKIISESNIQLLNDIINNHSISIKLDTLIPKASSIINDLLQITDIQDTGGFIRNALVQKYISSKVNKIQRDLPEIVQLIKMGNPDFIGHTDENYNEELMNIRKKLINETAQYTGNNIEEKIQAYEILESCIPYLTKTGSETREKLMKDDDSRKIIEEHFLEMFKNKDHNYILFKSSMVGFCNLVPHTTIEYSLAKYEKNSDYGKLKVMMLSLLSRYDIAYSIGKWTEAELNDFLTKGFDTHHIKKIEHLKGESIVNEAISSSSSIGLGYLDHLDQNNFILQRLNGLEKNGKISDKNDVLIRLLFDQVNGLEAYKIVDIYNELGNEKLEAILEKIHIDNRDQYKKNILQQREHKQFLSDLKYGDILNILKKGTPESIASFINDPSKLSSMRKVSNLYEDNSVNLVDYFDVYF